MSASEYAECEKRERRLLSAVSPHCHALNSRNVFLNAEQTRWVHMIELNVETVQGKIEVPMDDAALHGKTSTETLPPLVVLPGFGMPALSFAACLEGFSKLFYPRKVYILDWPGSMLSSRASLSEIEQTGITGTSEIQPESADSQAVSSKAATSNNWASLAGVAQSNSDCMALTRPFIWDLEIWRKQVLGNNTQFVLFGHSLGAYISMGWATYVQENFSGACKQNIITHLVLASPCGLPTLPKVDGVAETDYRKECEPGGLSDWARTVPRAAAGKTKTLADKQNKNEKNHDTKTGPETKIPIDDGPHLVISETGVDAESPTNLENDAQEDTRLATGKKSDSQQAIVPATEQPSLMQQYTGLEFDRSMEFSEFNFRKFREQYDTRRKRRIRRTLFVSAFFLFPIFIPLLILRQVSTWLRSFIFSFCGVFVKQKGGDDPIERFERENPYREDKEYNQLPVTPAEALSSVFWPVGQILMRLFIEIRFIDSGQFSKKGCPITRLRQVIFSHDSAESGSDTAISHDSGEVVISVENQDPVLDSPLLDSEPKPSKKQTLDSEKKGTQASETQKGPGCTIKTTAGVPRADYARALYAASVLGIYRWRTRDHFEQLSRNYGLMFFKHVVWGRTYRSFGWTRYPMAGKILKFACCSASQDSSLARHLLSAKLSFSLADGWRVVHDCELEINSEKAAGNHADSNRPAETEESKLQPPKLSFLYGFHDWMEWQHAYLLRAEIRKHSGKKVDLVRIPNSGHQIFAENPGGFVAALAGVVNDRK